MLLHYPWDIIWKHWTNKALRTLVWALVRHSGPFDKVSTVSFSWSHGIILKMKWSNEVFQTKHGGHLVRLADSSRYCFMGIAKKKLLLTIFIKTCFKENGTRLDLPTAKCIYGGVLYFQLVLYTITDNICGCITNYQ